LTGVDVPHAHNGAAGNPTRRAPRTIPAMAGAEPWAWVAAGLGVVPVAGWVVFLVSGRRAGSGLRLAALLAAVIAAAGGGYAATEGAGWRTVAGTVLGAAAGYLVGHTGGWVLERWQRRGLRGTVLSRDEPAAPMEVTLRTVMLPGVTVAGLAIGLSGLGGVIGLLALVVLLLVRREFVGAPLVTLVVMVLVVVLPLGVLRGRAMRDVRLRVDDGEVDLAYRRRGEPWQRTTLALAELRSVTVFADPYGRARLLRVDGGRAGRFELRAAPGLSGRGANPALRRVTRNLLGRPGWRPASGVRPYWSRWGTRRYRAVPPARTAGDAARDNGRP
jgi:hypothetical protein